jgi:hypothetical protein
MFINTLYFNAANNNVHVKFQVLMAANMKSIIFWNAMVHSLVKVHRSFEGKQCLLLQRQVSTASKQQRVLHHYMAYSLTQKMDVKDISLKNTTRPSGVTFHKTVLLQ